jgi:hypothetical protein
VLGANRLQRGLARWLELALEPPRYPFEQFFRGVRINGAEQSRRDTVLECYPFDSVGALEAERQDDGVGGAPSGAGDDNRVEAAAGFDRGWQGRLDNSEERCAITETGTGFAGAKLSEILPPLAMLGSSG